VRERQDESIKNYNGSQNKVFKESDEVMIKSYKQGSKESWLKATVKKVLGTKRYNASRTMIKHTSDTLIKCSMR